MTECRIRYCFVEFHVSENNFAEFTYENEELDLISKMYQNSEIL